jgi:hypothetical protein
MNDPTFADHWTRRDTEYYDPLVLVAPGGKGRLFSAGIRWLRQAGYDTPTLTALNAKGPRARDNSTSRA